MWLFQPTCVETGNLDHWASACGSFQGTFWTQLENSCCSLKIMGLRVRPTPLPKHIRSYITLVLGYLAVLSLSPFICKTKMIIYIAVRIKVCLAHSSHIMVFSPLGRSRSGALLVRWTILMQTSWNQVFPKRHQTFGHWMCICKGVSCLSRRSHSGLSDSNALVSLGYLVPGKTPRPSSLALHHLRLWIH